MEKEPTVVRPRYPTNKFLTVDSPIKYFEPSSPNSTEELLRGDAERDPLGVSRSGLSRDRDANMTGSAHSLDALLQTEDAQLAEGVVAASAAPDRVDELTQLYQYDAPRSHNPENQQHDPDDRIFNPESLLDMGSKHLRDSGKSSLETASSHSSGSLAAGHSRDSDTGATSSGLAGLGLVSTSVPATPQSQKTPTAPWRESSLPVDPRPSSSKSRPKPVYQNLDPSVLLTLPPSQDSPDPSASHDSFSPTPHCSTDPLHSHPGSSRNLGLPHAESRNGTNPTTANDTGAIGASPSTGGNRGDRGDSGIEVDLKCGSHTPREQKTWL